MASPAASAAAEVSEIDYLGLRCYSFTYTYAHNTQYRVQRYCFFLIYANKIEDFLELGVMGYGLWDKKSDPERSPGVPNGR